MGDAVKVWLRQQSFFGQGAQRRWLRYRHVDPAGIDWALQHDCAVISMSLGANEQEVHPPYVVAGQRALIIAAAGNNAARSTGQNGFVGTPANSPYVMAVAAIDRQLQIAVFSARSLSRRGGQVDAAGPGVDVYFSWSGKKRYNTISGTSMAAPHVAGVAALLSEATGFRGRELWAEIVQEARRLQLPSIDVGSGLGIAPPAKKERNPGHPAEQEPDNVVEWVVTVKSAYLSKLDSIAADLEAAGLRVTRVLYGVGMISGTAPEDQRDTLLQAPGVYDAEVQRRFTIAPPDSDVQ